MPLLGDIRDEGQEHHKSFFPREHSTQAVGYYLQELQGYRHESLLPSWAPEVGMEPLQLDFHYETHEQAPRTAPTNQECVNHSHLRRSMSRGTTRDWFEAGGP